MIYSLLWLKVSTHTGAIDSEWNCETIHENGFFVRRLARYILLDPYLVIIAVPVCASASHRVSLMTIIRPHYRERLDP